MTTLPETSTLEGVAAGRFARRLAHLDPRRVNSLPELPVMLALAVIWMFFEVQNSHFLTARNLTNLVLQIAVIGTIAIGLVFVLLLGEIDLSIGSVAGVTSAVLGALMVHHGWPWWAAVIAAGAAGAAIGAFQGAWLAIVGVPSFVVTLAGLLSWQGVQVHVLGASGAVNVFDSHISWFATSYAARWVGWVAAVAAAGTYAWRIQAMQQARQRAGLPIRPGPTTAARIAAVTAMLLGAATIANSSPQGGVPVAAFVLAALLLAFSWLSEKTRFGRQVYAVGGNAEAARRAGIDVTRVRITVFALSGLMAALGGILAVSREGAATTQTGGGNLLLEVVAAAVIGGTSLFGGRGRVTAALLGALVIGSVANGLDLIGQSADVKLMVEGAILLAAVSLDRMSHRGDVAQRGRR